MPPPAGNLDRDHDSGYNLVIFVGGDRMPFGCGTDAGGRARALRRETGELLSILEKTEDLSDALSALDGELDAPDFTECLARYMAERGLNAAQLSEAALLSRSFAYQLCSGGRRPSRDMALRLALVLGLSVEQTQAFLRSAQLGALYPRVTRDAVVIYALEHRLGVAATDERLLSLGQTGIL